MLKTSEVQELCRKSLHKGVNGKVTANLITSDGDKYSFKAEGVAKSLDRTGVKGVIKSALKVTGSAKTVDKDTQSFPSMDGGQVAAILDKSDAE